MPPTTKEPIKPDLNLHTGRCLAIGCSCSAMALPPIRIGFWPSCPVCTHTQHSHEIEEIPNDQPTS